MSSGESQSLGHRVVVQLDPVLIQRCRRCRWLEMRAVRIWRSAGRGRHRGRCDGSRGRQLRIAAAARFRLEGEVERRRRCQLRRHPGSWRLGTTHDTQTVGNNVMKNSGPFHFRAGARRERERAVGLSTSNEGIQHPAAANSIFICLCVCVSLLLMAGPVPELLVVYPQTAGLVAGAGGSAPVRHRRILPIGFGSCTSIHPLFYYRSCCRRRHNSSHRPLLFAGGFPISKIQHKAKGNGENRKKKEEIAALRIPETPPTLCGATSASLILRFDFISSVFLSYLPTNWPVREGHFFCFLSFANTNRYF